MPDEKFSREILPSCKLTILMVFTRKDRDFHGRIASLREGKCLQNFPKGVKCSNCKCLMFFFNNWYGSNVARAPNTVTRMIE